jgi:hypothetical protein
VDDDKRKRRRDGEDKGGPPSEAAGDGTRSTEEHARVDVDVER